MQANFFNTSVAFLDKPDPQDIPLDIVTLDDLLKKVNGEGRYQWTSFAIFNLQWFWFAWILLGGTFFFRAVDFECPGLDKEQCEKFVCSKDESEWGKYLPADRPQSIVYTMGSIYMCDKAYIITILTSLVFIGSLIGFFIIPYLADNWGRKKALFVAWGSCTIGVVSFAFANDINMVAVGQFLAGFGGNPAITLSYSFINEQSLGKSRQYFSIGIQIAYAVGEALLGLIFYYIPYWRTVAIIVLGPFVVINFLIFYLEESPKFMINKDSVLTLQIFNKIAKRNRKRPLKIDDVLEVQQNKQDVQHSGTSLFDLFRYKSLRMKSVAAGIVFFGIQTVYYSVAFNLGNVGNNIYVNQVIVGVSEGIGYLAAEIAIPKVYRKKWSFLGMGISSTLCLALALVGSSNKITSAISVGLLFVMRFSLCMFWAIFYVYLAEIFPTRIRSLAFGWASALGTIGSALSPYLIQISDGIHLSAWLFPAAIGIFSTGCIYFLPQTFGQPMEQQIQELKALPTEVPYETYVVDILQQVPVRESHETDLGSSAYTYRSSSS